MLSKQLDSFCVRWVHGFFVRIYGTVGGVIGEIAWENMDRQVGMEVPQYTYLL